MPSPPTLLGRRNRRRPQNRAQSLEASWIDLAAEFWDITESWPSLRADWLAFEGSEEYGAWVVRPGGARTAEVRAGFSLIAARAIEIAGIPPIPVPQPLQHFPGWNLLTEDFGLHRRKTMNLSDIVPYGLGAIDRDAVDPCTRAWLELLRKEAATFKLSEGLLNLRGKDYKVLSGQICDVCRASAICCTSLASGEIRARIVKRSGRSSLQGSADCVLRSGSTTGTGETTRLKGHPGRELNATERAARRMAIVGPVLEQRRWKPGRLVTEAGVSKGTLYGYLNGTRAWIAAENRKAIAEALDLKPEELPG